MVRAFFNHDFYVVYFLGEHLDKNSAKYFVALSTNVKIGAITFKKLLDFFVNLEEAWDANINDLKKTGLKEEQIKAILEVRKNVDPDKEIEKLRKLNIDFVTIKDKNYPSILKEIYDPPAILYYKGALPKENDLLVGVVGSRVCTTYGRQVAEDVSFNLAKEEIIIVSGLALGIDSIAHQAALDAKGKTIAVLGCGLDTIYPSSHQKLALDIVKNNGAILSEFPLGCPPYKSNFPMRNRIISGLSKAVVIIEAAIKSGALITARSALEQNREVFAVPGPIYSRNSEGTNSLIKMGAHPLTNSEDLFFELGIKIKAKKQKEIKGDTEEENMILEILSREPSSIDKLKELSKLDIAVLNSTLIMLEIKGMVKNIGGGQYIKV
ncbi:MAG: DNA-processing protein DprA [Candidatus Berkelbacteria bacterium]|nr:DNA-processing protein DprA [Candidatus Berkelbacteria bacterium]